MSVPGKGTGLDGRLDPWPPTSLTTVHTSVRAFFLDVSVSAEALAAAAAAGTVENTSPWGSCASLVFLCSG